MPFIKTNSMMNNVLLDAQKRSEMQKQEINKMSFVKLMKYLKTSIKSTLRLLNMNPKQIADIALKSSSIMVDIYIMINLIGHAYYVLSRFDDFKSDQYAKDVEWLKSALLNDLRIAINQNSAYVRGVEGFIRDAVESHRDGYMNYVAKIEAYSSVGDSASRTAKDMTYLLTKKDA